MTQESPGVRKQLSLSFNDSDRTHFSESSKLRTSSWSSLKPNDEWYILIHDIRAHTAKKLIEHMRLSLRSIPVDFLKPYIMTSNTSIPLKVHLSFRIPQLLPPKLSSIGKSGTVPHHKKKNDDKANNLHRYNLVAKYLSID